MTYVVKNSAGETITTLLNAKNAAQAAFAVWRKLEDRGFTATTKLENNMASITVIKAGRKDTLNLVEV